MANYLTEAQMNLYFGRVQGSDIPSVYVHLSGRYVDDAILKANGIKTEDQNSRNPNEKACSNVDISTIMESKISKLIDERVKQILEP
jgi:hypothetical protein